VPGTSVTGTLELGPPATPEQGQSSQGAAADAAAAAAETTPKGRCIQLLYDNLHGQWQRFARKSPIWAFFVPSGDELYAGQTLGNKQVEHLDCWVCHGGAEGVLHPSFPRTGKYAACEEDEDVSTWLPELAHKSGQWKCNEITFQSKHGNGKLEHHVATHHAALMLDFKARLDPPQDKKHRLANQGDF